MTFISNAQHQAFYKSVKDELSGLDPFAAHDGVVLLEGRIENYLQELERLHTEYQKHLQSIHALIQQYETIRKEARITLRKCIAAHRNEMSKRAKLLSRNNGHLSKIIHNEYAKEKLY